MAALADRPIGEMSKISRAQADRTIKAIQSSTNPTF